MTVPGLPSIITVVRAGRLLTWPSAPGRDWRLKSWPLPEGPANEAGLIPTVNTLDWDVDVTGEWVALAWGEQVIVRPIDGRGSGEERLVGSHRLQSSRLVVPQRHHRVDARRAPRR